MTAKRENGRRVCLWVLVMSVCSLLPGAVWAGPAQRGSDAESLARDILTATGVRGGMIVHLGCGDGRLTAALGSDDQYTVHGLDADAENVEAARRHVAGRGLYGRVSAERLAWR